MENLDFIIDQDDLKCLMVATLGAYKGYSFDDFVKETKESYAKYHKRNMENLDRYGNPKSYSLWINGQILALT
jgi:hypothetical protein